MCNAKTLVSILVILSIAITDMSTDIYAVALPKIAEYFKSYNSIVQFTIDLNLIGLSLSGLIYGPLSDQYGRRKVILVGMTIFALASIACCFAQNIMQLILMRFIQGLGAGVTVVVGYATIKDMYSGYECSQVISKLNMTVALSPAIAPIIGSYIISCGYSWRLLFVIISVLSVLTLLSLFFKFKETVDKPKCKDLTLTELLCKILKQYIEIFKNYRFLGFAAINSLNFMWIWAYIGNLPFVLIKGMNISAKYYGYLITIIIISYMIGAAINRKFVKKVGIKNMLLIGLFLPLISDLSLIFLYYNIGLTIVIMESFWLIANVGFAFVISNGVTSALEETEESGLSLALIAFMQMIFGAVGVSIVGYFSKVSYSIVPNLLLTVTCSIIAIAIYTLLHYSTFKLTTKMN
ncbi:multidrug effflux MFS transporter [Candidatus Mesenet endosymbiont of Agriotes lineatus]|uniref:multidrug effflux MFS transporter n=1 Tax=Candidatus Mesenet endosymbiont of Agriotes lineatus TaxID=3077948 RepID=UPI0030D52E63